MIRLLRGVVVVREELRANVAEYTHIVVLDGADAARDRTWHRGKVIAMGEPAQTLRGAEVAPGFAVGDTVIFHWEHLEKNFTRPWSDGELACWLSQSCIDAVVES